MADAPADEVQTIALSESGSAKLRVTNVYRSWERFYATVLPPAAAAAFSIEPTCGDLAPRGGANNVCDEAKPYMDFAEVTVSRRADVALEEAATLLVRTEEEQWIFRLSEGGDPDRTRDSDTSV